MFIQEIYLSQWFRTNAKRGKTVDELTLQLKSKIKSLTTGIEGFRELFLQTAYAEGCEQKVRSVLLRFIEDQEMEFYRQTALEVQFNLDLTAQSFDRVIEKVTAYEAEFGETLQSLEAKLTALSAIDYEQHEAQIEEILLRRAEYVA